MKNTVFIFILSAFCFSSEKSPVSENIDIPLVPGKYTNPNNIIKETYTIYFEVDQFVEKVQEIKYTYEYNRKGYPVVVNDTRYFYQ